MPSLWTQLDACRSVHALPVSSRFRIKRLSGLIRQLGFDPVILSDQAPSLCTASIAMERLIHLYLEVKGDALLDCGPSIPVNRIEADCTRDAKDARQAWELPFS